MSGGPPLISASLLNADLASLGEEVERGVRAGVDSLHADVMDGHFVPAITIGPGAVAAVRAHAGGLPVHSHLMVSRPLSQVRAFAEAGSDLIVFHVEAEDDPGEVIGAIRATGRGAGIALNPGTDATAVGTFLAQIDMVLVMTVHPGRGGQDLIPEVLAKVRALRREIDGRGLSVQIGIDGGVNLATIGAAHAAGGEVLVIGSALYGTVGELATTVNALRSAASSSA